MFSYDVTLPYHLHWDVQASLTRKNWLTKQNVDFNGDTCKQRTLMVAQIIVKQKQIKLMRNKEENITLT